MARLGLESFSANRLAPRAGQALAAGRQPSFSRLKVHRDLADALPALDWLRSRAPHSPYQQRAWLEAWLATEGRRLGVQPMIVVAEDTHGQPVALLPLGTRSRKGLRCAEFLGGRETNYNLGLFDPTIPWRSAEIERLLATAAAMVGGLDLIRLIHQPVTWEGVANPLAALPRSQPSPSAAYRADLAADSEAFLRRHLSGPARKKLRAKAGKLAALGPVVHATVREPREIREVLDAHLVQKAAKLAALGIRLPQGEAKRAFLEQACLASEAGVAAVELHALRCGDRIVATFGGLPDRGRFSGLFISHDEHAEYARCSPGEQLLNAVLREKCAAGFRTLDLGVGEARYKDSYCPEQDLLVDCVLPLTAQGHVLAVMALATLRAKAAIKQSPRAWAAVQVIRRMSKPLR